MFSEERIVTFFLIGRRRSAAWDFFFLSLAIVGQLISSVIRCRDSVSGAQNGSSPRSSPPPEPPVVAGWGLSPPPPPPRPPPESPPPPKSPPPRRSFFVTWAVANRRLGPTSSAMISTTLRRLPSRSS